MRLRICSLAEIKRYKSRIRILSPYPIPSLPQILDTDKPDTQLDTVLQHALTNAMEDKLHAKREAELSDKMVQALDSRMKKLQQQHDRDLVDKERHISHLGHLVYEREAQLRASEKALNDMTQKLAEVNDELKKCKARADLLEKTRRLGYYTPGKLVFFAFENHLCYVNL